MFEEVEEGKLQSDNHSFIFAFPFKCSSCLHLCCSSFSVLLKHKIGDISLLRQCGNLASKPNYKADEAKNCLFPSTRVPFKLLQQCSVIKC